MPAWGPAIRRSAPTRSGTALSPTASCTARSTQRASPPAPAAWSPSPPALPANCRWWTTATAPRPTNSTRPHHSGSMPTGTGWRAAGRPSCSPRPVSPSPSPTTSAWAPGAAAMAIGHALQHHTLPGFHLRALAPVSGPYDLPGAQLPGIFNGQIAAAITPYYVGYTLTAWNPLYHLYPAPQDAFRQAYAATVQGLFDGTHPDQQIIAALPPRLRDLLTTRYL